MAPNPRVYFDVQIGNDSELRRFEIELFADTNPRAAENFLGLCCNHSGLTFLKTEFFKLIPGMYIRGGDILHQGDRGTGASIFGGLFPDEDFSRRHASPGLLSMVSSGKDTNGSQFILTLKKTPELDGKNQVIGQIITGKEFLREIDILHTWTWCLILIYFLTQNYARYILAYKTSF